MSDGAYVGLLRGINVGGKNKLPMRSLLAIFEAASCRDVHTYIQSGNVVFRTGDLSGCRAVYNRRRVRHQGAGGPAERGGDGDRGCGQSVPRAGVPKEMLHVYFLADLPLAAAVEKLDPMRSPGDVFAVAGREIYLHLPHGTARTKLTNAYFDKALGTVSTLRNWRTVKVVAAMVGCLSTASYEHLTVR